MTNTNAGKKRINEYSVKLVKEKAGYYDVPTKRITAPRDLVPILKEVLGIHEKTQEHLVLVSLNTRNEVIGVHTVHIGAINYAIVSTRDIFMNALLANAKNIIIAHNHPSGNVEPSQEDINFSKKVEEAGNYLEITLIDSIIIGAGDDDTPFTSLKQEGHL